MTTNAKYKIVDFRVILLSSPYADENDPEIKDSFPNGAKRTIGMIEITLENGVKGLGEGYLAVFAPYVFDAIAQLCKPYLIGEDGFDITRRVKDLCSLCDYWSMQGAARHIISAVEIALVDAKSKSLGIPAYQLFNNDITSMAKALKVYGSGGCCDSKDGFLKELDLLDTLGITLYKIRALKHDIYRTAWILNEAGKRGIEVGIDMCQNLADPSQSVEDVLEYISAVQKISNYPIVFLEEAVGPDKPHEFKRLKQALDIKICGGEIITTPREMIDRINNDTYDFVQPDASVIGGISAVVDIFAVAQERDTDVVVHAWGGAAAIMASYHACFACGGELVEYPMLDFPLAKEMMTNQAIIENGMLNRPTAAGIGVVLTDDMENRYAFDETAVYTCKLIDWGPPPDSIWK